MNNFQSLAEASRAASKAFEAFALALDRLERDRETAISADAIGVSVLDEAPAKELIDTIREKVGRLAELGVSKPKLEKPKTALEAVELANQLTREIAEALANQSGGKIQTAAKAEAEKKPDVPFELVSVDQLIKAIGDDQALRSAAKKYIAKVGAKKISDLSDGQRAELLVELGLVETCADVGDPIF